MNSKITKLWEGKGQIKAERGLMLKENEDGRQRSKEQRLIISSSTEDFTSILDQKTQMPQFVVAILANFE